MKVKDLIKKLQKLDPNSSVVMSRDSEGNGFSPLEDVEVGVYFQDETWCGEFHGVPKQKRGVHVIPSAVCFWPVQ